METAPQQKQKGYRIGILGALAGMLVTFLLGVFVGLHPAWIPIKTSSDTELSSPVKLPAPAPDRDKARPSTTPQSQPATK